MGAQMILDFIASIRHYRISLKLMDLWDHCILCVNADAEMRQV